MSWKCWEIYIFIVFAFTKGVLGFHRNHFLLIFFKRKTQFPVLCLTKYQQSL